MMSDLDFNIWLEFFYHNKPHADILYNQLHHHNANSNYIFSVDPFLEAIMKETSRVPFVTGSTRRNFTHEDKENGFAISVSVKELCDTNCYQVEERFFFR